VLTLHFDYTSARAAVALLRLERLALAGHAVAFRGLDALTRSGEATQEQVRALAADYGITFVDDWVEDLSARHSVRLAGGLWEDDRS
jgi:hypothetical protein